MSSVCLTHRLYHCTLYRLYIVTSSETNKNDDDDDDDDEKCIEPTYSYSYTVTEEIRSDNSFTFLSTTQPHIGAARA